MRISRLDTYEGPCETASRLQNVKAEFCACTKYALKDVPEDDYYISVNRTI